MTGRRFGGIAPAINQILVFGFIDHFASRNPRHHFAQFLTNLFDAVFVVCTAGRFDRWLTNCVFQHKVADEFTLLDVCQNVLHRFLGLLVWQDAWASDVLAVFRCV